MYLSRHIVALDQNQQKKIGWVHSFGCYNALALIKQNYLTHNNSFVSPSKKNLLACISIRREDWPPIWKVNRRQRFDERLAQWEMPRSFGTKTEAVGLTRKTDTSFGRWRILATQNQGNPEYDDRYLLDESVLRDVLLSVWWVRPIFHHVARCELELCLAWRMASVVSQSQSFWD